MAEGIFAPACLWSRFFLSGHFEFLILGLAGWRSGIEKGVGSGRLGRSKTFGNINSRDDVRSLYECYIVTREETLSFHGRTFLPVKGHGRKPEVKM